ncbi:MAG: hypothetical protein NTY64_13905 [Deltaproteobacteria bacterium]|nr:hypothetical protein [Deltaproteobacteria bacterium]
MVGERLSLRKIKEVLRLKFDGFVKMRRTTQVRLTPQVLRAGSRETRESFLLCHPLW